MIFRRQKPEPLIIFVEHCLWLQRTKAETYRVHPPTQVPEQRTMPELTSTHFSAQAKPSGLPRFAHLGPNSLYPWRPDGETAWPADRGRKD
ncbi:hypothetical protein ILYODFUR_024867 [Ilyodon furcidens]|uniref:Uncharacterized protein n=1 Tax=Ilyodon furcidens TaxID=33524 RepID=A0ABV0TDT4_9TELE